METTGSSLQNKRAINDIIQVGSIVDGFYHFIFSFFGCVTKYRGPF